MSFTIKRIYFAWWIQSWIQTFWIKYFQFSSPKTNQIYPCLIRHIQTRSAELELPIVYTFYSVIPHKSFIHSNFDFYEVWSFLAISNYLDRMRKHRGNCAHNRQLKFSWPMIVFTNLLTYCLLCLLMSIFKN